MSGDWFTPDGEAISGLDDPGTTNRLSTLERDGGFYRPNFKSFGRFIRSAQVRKPVVEVAHAIARRAGELSPRHKSDSHGYESDDGSLAASFKVKAEAGEISVDRALRVKVEVYSEDNAAGPMEFGNKHVGRPGRRMLARAGAAYGDFKGGAKP